MPAAKPVIREDGTRYASAHDAARALQAEYGGYGSAATISTSITKCCNLIPGYKTAYGWRWRWEGPYDRHRRIRTGT